MLVLTSLTLTTPTEDLHKTNRKLTEDRQKTNKRLSIEKTNCRLSNGRLTEERKKTRVSNLVLNRPNTEHSHYN